MSDNFPFEDILYNEHVKSKKHKPMSMLNRAVQFSPFAALKGYDEAVEEKARRTDAKIELEEYQLEELNRRLNFLKDNIDNDYMIKVVYFVPDKRKSGGKYIEEVGIVSKIKEYECEIVMNSGTVIPISMVLSIESVDEDIFNTFGSLR